MRILAIDPGDKRIGIAISDPTEQLARPLTVLDHTSRDQDAERIASFADQEQVGLILVGQATDPEGKPNFSGRKSARLAGALRSKTNIPVILWDESHTTQLARQIQIDMNANRKKQRSHLDDHAAALILQSYLDQMEKSDGSQ